MISYKYLPLNLSNTYNIKHITTYVNQPMQSKQKKIYMSIKRIVTISCLVGEYN